ncbi:type II toxin-antitoxin system HicA family toxin [Candidatus Kaiserbacteria bacterium]|nr:type II toxin-antitoxin system HicA family toxin [Candidatus Kaiserbacteria bacterium]
MPRGLANWTYDDVVDVLKEHGFILNYTKGSHFYFIGNYEGRFRQVCVPYHGTRAIKPRTLRGIILQSGIPKNDWLKR